MVTTKLVIFDNGSSHLERLLGMMRTFGCEVDVFKPLTNPNWERYQGIIISGGRFTIPTHKTILEWYRGLLLSVTLPVLGICLGHKILGTSYGAGVRRMESPEFGLREVFFFKEFPLIRGKTTLRVHHHHKFELIRLPNCFENHASSDDCRIQAVKHVEKPQFGVQFHPEVDDRNEGFLLLQGFAKFLKT